jgi:hypothetical protein
MELTLNYKLLIFSILVFSLVISSCDDASIVEDNQYEFEKLEYDWEISDNLPRRDKPQDSNDSEPKLTTFHPDSIRPRFGEYYYDAYFPNGLMHTYLIYAEDARSEVVIDTSDGNLKVKFDLNYEMKVLKNRPNWKKEYWDRVVISSRGEFIDVSRNFPEFVSNYDVDIVLANSQEPDMKYFFPLDKFKAYDTKIGALSKDNKITDIILDFNIKVPFILSQEKILIVGATIEIYYNN